MQSRAPLVTTLSRRRAHEQHARDPGGQPLRSQHALSERPPHRRVASRGCGAGRCKELSAQLEATARHALYVGMMGTSMANAVWLPPTGVAAG